MENERFTGPLPLKIEFNPLGFRVVYHLNPILGGAFYKDYAVNASPSISLFQAYHRWKGDLAKEDECRRLRSLQKR